MKLNQLITNDNMITGMDNVFIANGFLGLRSEIEGLITPLYHKHGTREVREAYEENLLAVWVNYVKANFKKMHYIIQTAKEDFLKSENTSVSESVDQDYNVDYYGGEGQTGKDTGSNTSKSSNQDLRNRLWNFASAGGNRVFYEFFNMVCETFEIGGVEW